MKGLWGFQVPSLPTRLWEHDLCYDIKLKFEDLMLFSIGGGGGGVVEILIPIWGFKPAFNHSVPE